MSNVVAAVLAVLVRIAWFIRYAGEMTGQTPPSIARLFGLPADKQVELLICGSVTIIVGRLGLDSNPWSSRSIVGSVVFVSMAFWCKQWRVAAIITSPLFVELICILLMSWLNTQLNAMWDVMVFKHPHIFRPRRVRVDVPAPAPARAPEAPRTPALALMAPRRRRQAQFFDLTAGLTPM